MNICHLSALERAVPFLDELLEVCRKDGAANSLCPGPTADVRRKANALKSSLTGLKVALDNSDSTPPPPVKPKTPLWERINERKELQEIANLLKHHGVPEAELCELTRRLAGEVGNERVSEAITEMIQTDREIGWVTLRSEVKRACRIFTGPAPDEPDYAIWWSTRGGPPTRSPEDHKARLRTAGQEALKEAAQRGKEAEEAPPETKKPRTRKKKVG